MEKKHHRIKVLDLLFFMILLLAAAGIFFALFRRQVLTADDTFPSDMKAYILEIQGLNDKYSFPYPILFWLGRLLALFTTPELAMALATMLLNTLGIVATKWMMDSCLQADLKTKLRDAGYAGLSECTGVFVSLAAVSLFFISMLYLPGHRVLYGIRFRYLGVFSANPFHNATYMAARPFAVLSFFAFADVFEHYRREDFLQKGSGDLKRCLFFSVVFLLSTMAKPSFTIVLVGVAGLKMLWELFSSRGKKLKTTILLGLCFIPTFLDLLYQYSGVFVASDKSVEAGIGFGLGEVWHQYCTFLPNSILLAMGFPLAVLIFHFGELKRDSLYRFSWQIYGMGFAMAYLLFEKGFRIYDFNFSWGYMYGIFFCFLGSLIVLGRDTAGCIAAAMEKGEAKKHRTRDMIFICIQWGAFLLHLLCGIFYFLDLLKGNTQY